jgi:hypothetical protein
VKRGLKSTYDSDWDTVVTSGAVKVVTPLISVVIVTVVLIETVGTVVVTDTVDVTVDNRRMEEQKAEA